MGAEKKFVPDFFDGEHDLDFLGQRNELADLLLRAPPGIAVRGLRIYDGGYEENSVAAPELRIVERCSHACQRFFDDGRVAR